MSGYIPCACGGCFDVATNPDGFCDMCEGSGCPERANPDDSNCCMSGYIPCACGGCFEITIGEPGAFCDDCEAAGCPERLDPDDTDCCLEPEPDSEDFPGFTPRPN